MKESEIKKLIHYHNLNLSLEDIDKLPQDDISRKMIANCIDNILGDYLENDVFEIDLFHLEKFGLHIHYKESAIIIITDKIIDKIFDRDIDNIYPLLDKLKKIINSNYNELFIEIDNDTKPFYVIDHLELIWNNKELMNYILNL